MAKKVFTTLMTAALVCTLLIGSASAAIGTGTATEGLRIRETKFMNSETVGLLYFGTKVTVLEETYDMYKIEYNGVVGFVPKVYMDFVPSAEETAAAPAEAAAETAASTIRFDTVNTNSVRLRGGTGSGAATIAYLDKGKQVVVYEDMGNGMFKVTVDGMLGYIAAQYIGEGNAASTTTASASATVSVPQTEQSAGYVKGTHVRLREGAGENTKILKVTVNNAPLTITGSANGWVSVVYNGTAGYIRADYVARGTPPANTQASAPATASSIGEQVVEFAKQYMGYPYVWAGSSPSTGFDCSGFTSYVFKSLGFPTNRVAQDIYENGTYVDYASLMPGDAVFFGTSIYNIGHVGIYIGNNQFIHANSAAGYVMIDGLGANDWYTNGFVGGRRIAS